MTPEQLDIVGRTAAAIETAGERFAGAFYERLFARSPESRPLFPADMSVQRTRLVDEMVLLAEIASDLTGFLDRARRLGARHRHYGVRPHHYAVVGEVLLDSLGVALGDELTDEVVAAWARLYELVADAMMEGATGELFAEPGDVDRPRSRSQGGADEA